VTSDERWLAVTGYPGYEVSDQGRVRSLDREVRSRWGTPKKLKGRVLKQALVGGNGETGRYYGCTLWQDGKRKQVVAHVLALETFVGERPEGMNGCHRDDDPANNHLENLYWGTQAQNVNDAIVSGRHASVAEAAKTHCPRGHEYTEGNTYIKPSTGHRSCKACHCDEVKSDYHSKHPDVRPAQSDRTHCPWGHPYDEANTYRAPGSPNKRLCRACSRRRSAASYRRRRGN
jgi:hypothetical protein